MLQLHAVLNLAINSAVNKVINVAANLKGMNVKLFKKVRYICVQLLTF